MIKKIGVVMDPIAGVNRNFDSTISMMLEAKKRQWQVFYMEIQDLFLKSGDAFARMSEIEFSENATNWYSLSERKVEPLAELDVILMRKDPPVDLNYIYATQILEIAEKAGVYVANKPQTLRDANEKISALWFPQLCPETLITKNINDLREFVKEHKMAILKPLNMMGGRSVFFIEKNDTNQNVIFETMTENENTFVLIQRYLPEIKDGDHRILLIDGKPFSFVMTRSPTQGDFRANFDRGGSFIVQKITQKQKKICDTLSEVFRDKGLLFVGIDIIGDYLIEVNVTSPGTLAHIESRIPEKISPILFDAIEKMI
ncbi:MAG: glutathione synthase [Gammaproteobacteria bacterium]